MPVRRRGGSTPALSKRGRARAGGKAERALVRAKIFLVNTERWISDCRTRACYLSGYEAGRRGRFLHAVNQGAPGPGRRRDGRRRGLGAAPGRDRVPPGPLVGGAVG